MHTPLENTPPRRLAGRTKLLWEIGLVSARLGLTSFGGPAAHLGYFYAEYVQRRKWMDEHSYADLVSLCHFMPGPASSQVGIGIGMIRAGMLGGLIAWLGFTLPSALLLILFALLMQGLDVSQAGWLHGLKIVAVAIVAQAIIAMGQKLAPDRVRATIVVLAAAAALFWQTVASQVLIIVLAGIIGVWLYRHTSMPQVPQLIVPVSRSVAVGCLIAFAALLALLPVLRQQSDSELIAWFDSFYRSGALVFGGGHVVLPLLERELVPSGWISPADFIAGYGAAQAVPGPLFTFATYAGAMLGGIPGAVLATVAIFLPAYLLVAGILPFWNSLRQNKYMQGAFTAIQAAVVGVLLAALYDPLWKTAVLTPADFVLAASVFVLLMFWKAPPWLAVAVGMAGGTVIGWL